LLAQIQYLHDKVEALNTDGAEEPPQDEQLVSWHVAFCTNASLLCCL
jgi:hypothetical protein